MVVRSFPLAQELEKLNGVVINDSRLKGSHESRIHVKTHDQNQLWISGNPTKFLQGHNIFGTNDLLGICVEFYKQVVVRLELPASLVIFRRDNLCRAKLKENFIKDLQQISRVTKT